MERTGLSGVLDSLFEGYLQMKKVFLILICIFLSLQLWGEETEKKPITFDSLFIFEKGEIGRDSLILYLTGKMFWQNGDFFESIPYLEAYLYQNPEAEFSPDALLYIADSYQKLDLSAMGLKIFSELNNRFPFSKSGIWALKKMGDIYFSKKDYSRAKLLYLNFIYHNFNLKLKDSAFFQIERCNFYLGIYQHPTEIFQNFLQKYPKSKLCPELKFELGNYYFSIGEFSNAISKYNELIKTIPEISWLDSVYFQLAMTYHAQRDWKNAIKILKPFPNKFPKSSLRNQAYQLLIECFLAEKNYLAAIDSLNSLIKRTPTENKNKYYLQLVNIYEELGLYNEVIDIYQIMLHNKKDETMQERLKEKIKDLRLKIKG
jgi:TolA-binding protein